jgi:hypothetical protein
MRIPIPSAEDDPNRNLCFSHFLPIASDQFLTLERDGLTLTLWFDRECITAFWGRDTEDFSKWANPSVNQIMADVVPVEPVSEELLQHLRSGNLSDVTQAVLDEYVGLGTRIYSLTLTHVNRLMRFAHSVKGQYWLEEYLLDPVNQASAFAHFRSKVQIDSAWFNWLPPSGAYSRAVIWADDPSYIRKEDWPSACDFVKSSKKPPLVAQLLAGAQRLQSEGHRRAALTEAVTALEVALHEFARSPKAVELFSPGLAKRMAVESIHSQIDHLGLSGSVRYLLPVLFSEDKMPTDVLLGCREAWRNAKTLSIKAKGMCPPSCRVTSKLSGGRAMFWDNTQPKRRHSCSAASGDCSPAS